MPELWRISRHQDLSGEGGRRAFARWHHAGKPIVYLAESPPGALLEVLVHLELDPGALPPSYTLLHVSAPAELDMLELIPESDTWRDDVEISRDLGSEWISDRRTALARVPSVIMPKTWNVLLNPLHPAAEAVRVVGTDVVQFDPRLLR